MRPSASATALYGSPVPIGTGCLRPMTAAACAVLSAAGIGLGAVGSGALCATTHTWDPLSHPTAAAYEYVTSEHPVIQLTLRMSHPCPQRAKRFGCQPRIGSGSPWQCCR